MTEVQQEAQAYSLREGLLYKGAKLCIPQELQKIYLIEAHDSLMGGHLGEHKTLDRLSAYHWRGMTRDVKLHVEACIPCGLKKPKPPGEKSKLMPALPRPYQPFSEINIDIIVGLPPSKRGNNCILIVVDKMSRWVEAYPLPNSTASTVATVLLTEFVSRFGCPLRIVSDRGSNFTSELLREVVGAMNIQQGFSPAYCPWVNGAVERANGSIVRMLRNFVNDTHDDWDNVLPFVLFAYRASINRMTGHAPFQLVFGTDARLPSMASLLSAPPESTPTTTSSS